MKPFFKRLSIAAVVMALPIFAHGDGLSEYYQSIDSHCNTAADCVVKDVGNCCGYFPKCVNKNSKVNRQLVMEHCKKQGVAGVCGFPSVESCQCVQKKCEASVPR